MNEQIAAARNTFSSFPVEVFELWLDDRVREKGWPPHGNEWWSFLAGKPVSFWQSLSWCFDTVSLSPEELTEESWAAIEAILEANVLGIPNAISAYLPDTNVRFRYILSYVQRHGRIPTPIILLRESGVYHVIDGHHRLAAVFVLQSHKMPLAISTWIAHPRN